MKMERSIAGVQPWNAETPNMYTVVLRLRDEKMNLVETGMYYQVMADTDPGIQKALEVLGNEKQYKSILKGK